MYPIKLYSKRLWLVATLLLCFVYCGGLPVQAESIPLDQSYEKSNLVYDGTVFEVSGMTGLTAPIVCNLWSPNIKGGGLTFKGVDSTVASTLKTLSVNVTDARVLDATIYITNYLPPSSNLAIARTTAEMKGTTILFNLQGFISQSRVVVYLMNTTATWTYGTGGDVLSLAGGTAVGFTDNSGLFLRHTHATGARSMVSVAGSCAINTYCFTLTNSLFAVDNATCKDCTGPFFEGGIHTIVTSHNGVFRLMNCTHISPNEDQPLFHFNAQHQDGFLVYGWRGNVIFSALTTYGPVFLLEGSNTQAFCKLESHMAFNHINAKSLGFEGRDFHHTVENVCDVYLGNITLGEVTYHTKDQFTGLNMAVTNIIDAFGKILFKVQETIGDNIPEGGYSAVYCTRGYGYNNAVVETKPSQAVVDEYAEIGLQIRLWSRSRCVCNRGKFLPYCTNMFDPLPYSLGYTFEEQECTTDPVSCRKCKWEEWDTCAKCNTNYKFNEEGECVPMVCQLPCATCLEDSETQCETCKELYKLVGTACVLKGCAKDPCTGCVSPSGNTDTCEGCLFPFALNPVTQQCDTCDDHYKMDDGRCVLKNCAKGLCTECVTPSGNDDTCQGCLFPFALNPVTQQCDACEDNYKMDGNKCVLKNCAKGLCTACKNPSGNDEACKTCAFPSTVDPITQQCDACEDHYKLVDSTCVLKSCAKFPCTGCVDPSGNDDTCQGCLFPFTLDPSTGQCDTCVPGFKYIRENSTCVEKQCLVENCQSCVFDQEYQCNSCGSGSSLDGSSQCSAASVENNLGTVGLVGIIIAIVVVVIIVVFLLVYFLCCREAKPAYEEVEHVEMKERTTSIQNKNLPCVEVEEETEVTLFQPECEGNEGNPLATNGEKSEQPTEEKGRQQQRRARNIRRNHIDVEDVNLETMYSRENEIFEDM